MTTAPPVDPPASYWEDEEEDTRLDAYWSSIQHDLDVDWEREKGLFDE